MSASPPKAAIERHNWHVRFVPKADSCSAAKPQLFDHLVGAGKQRRRTKQVKLLTKSAPHLGQSLLACGLVASVIGCPCTLHALPDSIDRLRRYFSHPLLNGFQRTRCRLRARSGHGFRSRRGPVGSFCFEHGIDLCLHGGEVVPTWTAVTRRNRGGERSCCVHYYRLHSHNSPPQVRG